MRFLRGAKGSWVWLVVRLYIGYQWAMAGWEKVTGATPFDASGFLKGAAAKALPGADGAKPVVQAWWGNFLNSFAIPNAKLFNFLIPWGELLVGMALIFGFATIFAAIMGMTMNFAFLLSGTISSNPNYLIFQFILIAMGGAYAGFIGIDYWFRPLYREFVDGLFDGQAATTKVY